MNKILNVILSRYTLATRRINSIKQMSMLRISGSKYYIWTQFVLVLLLATVVENLCGGVDHVHASNINGDCLVNLPGFQHFFKC